MGILLRLLLIAQIVFCKEIDSKSDLLQEESYIIPAEHRAVYGDYQDLHSGSLPSGLITSKNLANKYEPSLQPSSSLQASLGASNQNDAWALSSGVNEAAQIKAINVKCDKTLMKVNIEFDRPFHGVIFSKGHYSDPKCVHLPAGTGQTVADFDIHLRSCGMSSNDQSSGPNALSTNTMGLFIENTVIVQYDPQVQEIWDQARKLRCTWYDFYEKAVTFRPFGVDMQDAVTANFLGDNIQCWMQIQVGRGPWASEVAGIVKIGQEMTMVLAIKDEENKFDMLVRNCVAHDGKNQPIQLVDEFGCIVRSKVMSRFKKVRNFGHSASVVSYAYFQAFKFPDSMNVHFQCVIQVCRGECPAPQCDSVDSHNDYRDLHYEEANKFAQRMGELASNHRNHSFLASSSSPSPSSISGTTDTSGRPRALRLDVNRRSKRSTKSQDVNTQKIIQVVSPGDVAFALPVEQSDSDSNTNDKTDKNAGVLMENMICMSTTGFAFGIVILILLLLLTCVITIFLMVKLRNFPQRTKEMASYTNYKCSKHPTIPCVCEPIVESPNSIPTTMFKLPNVQLARIS